MYEFIWRKPSKEDIKLVSREIKERIREAHKFKPVADSFVELMSLFTLELKEAGKGKGVSESSQKMFNEIVEKIEMKLNKEDVLKWIRRVQAHVTEEVGSRYLGKQLETMKGLWIGEKKSDEETIARLKEERKNLENALRTIIDKLGMESPLIPIDMLPTIVERLTAMQKQSKTFSTLNE